MNTSETKIAIFDFDGTLVETNLWLGLIKHHLKTKEKLWATFWYLFSHLALMPFWKMGFISTEKYYQSWGQDLVVMIKGIRIEKAKKIFASISNEYLLPSLKKKVWERVKHHQEEGFLTILTSGSFQELLEIIAKRLHIDFVVGTELEVVKDRFSGKIIPPFCFGREKAEKVRKFLSGNGLKINFKESFAYSDSFFDLPLLELVGNPVAVEPDKKLLEIAKNKDWQVI
ncbi:MAG: HAD family hydrolase [Patescibacteria group bacterium]|nr:HAD family hydrolase [Patescibacteria group bacterium]